MSRSLLATRLINAFKFGLIGPWLAAMAFLLVMMVVAVIGKAITFLGNVLGFVSWNWLETWVNQPDGSAPFGLDDFLEGWGVIWFLCLGCTLVGFIWPPKAYRHRH